MLTCKLILPHQQKMLRSVFLQAVSAQIPWHAALVGSFSTSSSCGRLTQAQQQQQHQQQQHFSTAPAAAPDTSSSSTNDDASTRLQQQPEKTSQQQEEQQQQEQFSQPTQPTHILLKAVRDTEQEPLDSHALYARVKSEYGEVFKSRQEFKKCLQDIVRKRWVQPRDPARVAAEAAAKAEAQAAAAAEAAAKKAAKAAAAKAAAAAEAAGQEEAEEAEAADTAGQEEAEAAGQEEAAPAAAASTTSTTTRASSSKPKKASKKAAASRGAFVFTPTREGKRVDVNATGSPLQQVARKIADEWTARRLPAYMQHLEAGRIPVTPDNIQLLGPKKGVRLFKLQQQPQQQSQLQQQE